MRADSINVNSGKFGAVDRTDLASPIVRDYRQEVIRQSDDTNTAITLTTAQSGALVLFDENEAYAITMPAVTLDDVGITYTFMETIASNTDRNINTAYDNDYFVGSLVVLPSAVWGSGTAQDGLAANIVANAANDVQITFDDDLANGAGGVGSIVNLTAIVTGNTGAGGGAKLVWAVTGQMFTADPNSNGTAIFT
jgi:hypothetical protein|tara:strand:+ start:670 stop:1254 length:585 start_codon:yes stop_codon:yes gene_type:complete